MTEATLKELRALQTLVEMPEWNALEEVFRRIRELRRDKLEHKGLDRDESQFIRGECHRLRQIVELRGTIHDEIRAATAREVAET